MKRYLSCAVLAAILSAIFTVPVLAQTSTVKGTCRDAQGQPVPGAEVVWKNTDNGRSYKLKTNKKGEYFSLGIDPGTYTVTLTGQDGKELYNQKNVKVSLDELTYDIDLKQIQQENIQQTAKEKGISTEEVKKQQAAAAEAQKYNANVKAINDKLHEATNLLHAQPPSPANYDQAISILTETTQMAPDQDVVWYALGNADLESTRLLTDKDQQTKRNTDAYNNLKKAIDLYNQHAGAAQPGQPGGAAPKPASPNDNLRLAAYYDNLGQASARIGKTDEAVNAYKQAAELDQAHAGDYYFKEGAVLTNSGSDENARKAAAAAFDKAIAADPNKADAYYWKGSNLIGMATTDSAGKLVAPEGTAEAFQKYLELQPNGPHAEEAKQMLAAMNQTVESSYGKKSTTKKK